MPVHTATLISFGSWLASKIADKGFEELYKKISAKDLNKRFYKAVTVVSEKLQTKYPEILGGSIEHFFKKEEIFSELIKLLFRNSKIDNLRISETFDTRTLPDGFIEEFITTLRLELLKDQDFDRILSDNELFIAILGIGQDVSVIAQNSNITTYEVSRISKLLDQRIGKSFTLEKFLELYSKNAQGNLSQVNFIGLGIDISMKKNRKKLTDIFVSPKLVPYNENVKWRKRPVHDHNLMHEINYKDLLVTSNKIVILGDPGSGKSILVKSLICDILSKSRSIPDQFHTLIPFRIELRKFLAFKSTYTGTIISYLTNILESEYQIPNLTETIVQNILVENRSIIFFDGLDEIFDIADKIATKNAVENFTNVYPEAMIVVTSRVIGYEEARLNEEIFKELSILEFKDTQVVEYVNKWYTKEEQNKEIRKKEIRGFLDKKSQIDVELIRNPLLLSLIVIIYRNILKLPESKLEIYQSCTKTLVDKWDASKELEIKLDSTIVKNKDKLFAELAYWQYKHLSSKSLLITYEKAKSTVAKSISEKLKISDDFQSEELAENFMAYAQKRSIYFENNFTHKTFLEYYTAYWIYSNVEKKHNISERDKLLKKYIGNSFWFIVLELLFNLIDKDQGDSDVIDGIINQQVQESVESLPFLLSILPSLKNVDVAVVSKLIKVSIEYVISHQRKKNNYESTERLEAKIFSNLKNLLGHPLLRELIYDELQGLEEKLVSTEGAVKLYSLVVEIENFGMGGDAYEIRDRAKYESAVSLDSYLFVLDTYAHQAANSDYMSSVMGFVEKFGRQACFRRFHAYYDNFSMPGFFSYFLTRQLRDVTKESIRSNFDRLMNLGFTEGQILKYIQKEHHHFWNEKDALKRALSVLEESEDVFICKVLLSLMAHSYQDVRVGVGFWNAIPHSEKMNLAKEILGTKVRQPNDDVIDKINNFFSN